MSGAIVIGTGPGIGTSVARRFAREGLPVSVVARSPATVEGALAALEPAGVHVVTVTVAGTVAPGSAFDPDEIAAEYWRLHTQPPGAWQREVLYAGRVTASAGGQRSEAAG
jgi:NAD(P)-dependent dehydrogenase (short-subunit alcohol dehydrogenase family)